MARGKSGRIVIEIDPSVKRALYASLARDNRTLKEWFVESAEIYIRHGGQLLLFEDREPSQERIDKDGSRE